MDPVNSGPDALFVFQGGCIALTIDVRVYRLVAVQKTAYKMAAKCTVVLGDMRDQSLGVTLTFAPGTNEREAVETARLFYQDLLDQELREKVGEETSALRTLILAHAYSRTSLSRRE